MRKWLALVCLLCASSAAQAQLTLTGIGAGGVGGGAAPGAMTSPVMTAGSTAAPSATAINYGKLTGGVTANIWGVTASGQAEPWPVTGSFDNLAVYLATDPATAGSSYDVGIVVNGTRSTTLVCNVAAGAHACTKTVGGAGVAVTAGQLVGWYVCPSTSGNTLSCTLATGSGVPAVQAAPLQVSATFKSNVAQEGYLITHNSAPSTSVVNYGAVMSNGTANATENLVSGVMPAAGTVDNLYVQPSNSPSPGTETITVAKNGTAGSVTCTVSANAQCTDLFGTTGHSMTFAAGDTISIQYTPASTPTSRVYAVGMRWVPSVTNQAVILDTFTTVPPTTGTRYYTPNGGGAASAAETSELTIAPVLATQMTMGNLTVLQSTAPGGATTRTVTLRAGAAGGASQTDQAPSCTVASAATTCTSANTYSPTTGLALDVSTTANGTNAGFTFFKFGMTVTIP